MKQLKSHVRHDDPEIMSISHIHVLLLSSGISLIVSLTLPSWFPVLVLKLPNHGSDAYNVRKKRGSLKARDCCKSKARIVYEQHFSISLNRLIVVKALLKCAICFSISLVLISEFVYATFSPTCVRCTHLLKK